MRSTFHDASKEVLLQVGGVVLGALLTFGVVRTVGFTPTTLALAVLAAFAVARIIGAGQDGANATSVTILLVGGPVFDLSTVENRLFGIVAGSLIALVFSLWTRPGLPHERALTDARRHADDVVALITEIAGAARVGRARRRHRGQGMGRARGHLPGRCDDRHWQPVLAWYSTAFATSRRSSPGRGPRAPRPGTGSSSRHWVSVKSVGYGASP